MATKISWFFMRIVLSSVFCLHHICLCWHQSSSLSCLHACCLAFLPPVFISFLSYFFCSLLDFSLYCLLPSLPFPVFLHSVLPFYLSVFLVCFSVFLSDRPLFLHVFLACLRSFFCLSSFVIFSPSFFHSFSPSLFFQNYTPSLYSRLFLSAFPSFLLSFLLFAFLFSCFLAFPLLSLRSSSLPNNKITRAVVKRGLASIALRLVSLPPCFHVFSRSFLCARFFC